MSRRRPSSKLADESLDILAQDTTGDSPHSDYRSLRHAKSVLFFLTCFGNESRMPVGGVVIHKRSLVVVAVHITVCLLGILGGMNRAGAMPPPPVCAACNYADGKPLGAQARHSCAASQGCLDCMQNGWCRKDNCVRCPGINGTPAAAQCQNQATCELGGQDVSLCLNICS